jgi:hypothetical protein
MAVSRGRTLLYVLSVGIGTAAVIASFAFDVTLINDYLTLHGTGLMIVAIGLNRLGRTSNSEHAGLVAVGGGLGGLLLIVADGLLGLDGLLYVGLAVMVVGGLSLFASRPTLE